MITGDQDMRVRHPHESREILEILGEPTTLRLRGSFNCQPFECVTFYDPGHEASIGEYEDYMIATIRSIRESRFFGFDNIPTSRISWVIVGPENWDLLFRSEFTDQTAADRFPWAQICIRGSNQNLIVARGGMFEERAFPRVVAHSGRLIQSGDNSAQYLGGSYTTYSTERAKDLKRLKPDVVRELLHEFAHLFQARKEPIAAMMDNPALSEGEVETFARIFMNTQHDLPESTRFLAQINPTKHSWDELNDPNNGIEFPAEPVGTNEIYGMWFLGYLG